MLIRAAVRMGAIAGGANDRQLDDMTGYAENIGLAFQIADDVLNVTGTREEARQESEYRRRARQENLPDVLWRRGGQTTGGRVCRPSHCPSRFPRRPADPLRELARYITARKN